MVDNIKLKGDTCLFNVTLLTGIVWSQQNPKNFVTRPISSLVEGLMYGGLCTFGVKFISDKMNSNGKYAFAGLLGLSALYHLYRGYRDDPPYNRNNRVNIVMTSS